MPRSETFANNHNAAFDAHSAKQWQEVIDLLMPIIPQLSKPRASHVNGTNEFDVRFYADCNYLVAYSLKKLNKPVEALAHAQEALQARQIMPEYLRLDTNEDDCEQAASLKLVKRLTKIIKGNVASADHGIRFHSAASPSNVEPQSSDVLENTSQQGAPSAAAGQ